jgi:hypothetical protein
MATCSGRVATSLCTFGSYQQCTYEPLVEQLRVSWYANLTCQSIPQQRLLDALTANYAVLSFLLKKYENFFEKDGWRLTQISKRDNLDIFSSDHGILQHSFPLQPFGVFRAPQHC